MSGGGFAYIDEPIRAVLQSPKVPWKHIYNKTGLCFRIHYLMPDTKVAKLEVFSETQHGQSLIWSLSGFHGRTWQIGSMPFAESNDFKVLSLYLTFVHAVCGIKQNIIYYLNKTVLFNSG